MSRADGGWPAGMRDGKHPQTDFPYFPIHSDAATAWCPKCEHQLLAAVVVHPLGLALMARTVTRSAPVSEQRTVREGVGRDAAKFSNGVAYWGEWVRDVTDLSPADGWCPTHGAQRIDVERLVAAVRRRA